MAILQINPNQKIMHLYRKQSAGLSQEDIVHPDSLTYDSDKNLIVVEASNVKKQTTSIIENSYVFGKFNEVGRSRVFISGGYNNVKSYDCNVFGQSNIVNFNSDHCVIAGDKVEIISGERNFFAGMHHKMRGQFTAVFGVGSQPLPDWGFESNAVDAPRLIVGNGTVSGNYDQTLETTSNALVVLQSGAVKAPSLTTEMLDALDVDQQMLITKEHLNAYVAAKISEIPPLDFAYQMANFKFGLEDTFTKWILVYPDLNDIAPAQGVRFRRDAVNQIPYNDLPIDMNTPILLKFNSQGGLDGATFKVDILREDTTSIGNTSFNGFTAGQRIIMGYNTITSNTGSATFIDEVKDLQNDVKFIEVHNLNWELADANAPLIFELSAPYAWAEPVTWSFDTIVDKIVFTDPYNDVVTEYINTEGHEYFKLITEGDFFGDNTHLAVWKDGVEKYLYFGSSDQNVLNKSTGF